MRIRSSLPRRWLSLALQLQNRVCDLLLGSALLDVGPQPPDVSGLLDGNERVPRLVGEFMLNGRRFKPVVQNDHLRRRDQPFQNPLLAPIDNLGRRNESDIRPLDPDHRWALS